MSGDAGINTALLSALPDAGKVLELGCARGLLGARYKADHPDAQWHGVDVNEADLADAAEMLDSAICRDLDIDSATSFGEGYDLVVLGDVLEHLKSPERILSELHVACTPDARLAMCMPNLGHVSVIERMLFGDVMYDDAGLLDRTHLRIFTPHAVFKMLMDCGWLPRAVSRYRAGHQNEAYTKALYEAALALGISHDRAQYNLETYQLIILANRWIQPAQSPPLALAVIVEATNEVEASLNIMRSPGLQEIGATIMPLKGAASPAAALTFAKQHSDAQWFMFADQGVYFPKGSGHMLSSAVAALPETVRSVSVFPQNGDGERTPILVRRDTESVLETAAQAELRVPLALP